MDIIRFLGLYLIFSSILLINTYFIIKLLKDKNRDNLTYNLLLFFIFQTSAGFINIIYSMIFEPIIVSLLHRIGFMLATFCFFFMLNFNLILLKTNKVFKLKKQIELGLSYLIIFLIIFLTGDIKINESTDWKPQWSFSFTITLFLTFTIMLAIPILITLFKIFSYLSINELKKKIKILSIGIIGYFISYYFILIYNSTGNLVIRLIWLIYSPSMLLFSYFIYKGYFQSIK